MAGKGLFAINVTLGTDSKASASTETSILRSPESIVIPIDKESKQADQDRT
jgi:hypothetical protein